MYCANAVLPSLRCIFLDNFKLPSTVAPCVRLSLSEARSAASLEYVSACRDAGQYASAAQRLGVAIEALGPSSNWSADRLRLRLLQSEMLWLGGEKDAGKAQLAALADEVRSSQQPNSPQSAQIT